MDAYKKIEERIRKKYGKDETTRKAVGDFMLADDHAVNIKSNNVEKANYSPNMISIKKMHEWVYEKKNLLSFVFVDYSEQNGELVVLKETGLVPIQSIDWSCLSIEAQGYGVIQMPRPLKIIPSQTKSQFYEGFLVGYKKFIEKERRKHERFAEKFLDPKSIDW